MAKNIDFMGATFPDVPSIRLPQHEGGLVSFDDTTDATATADKILQGYTAYANGQKLVGTASGGITPSGTMSITSNGIYDIVSFASVDVNVSGGGGITADDIINRTISGAVNGSASLITASAFASCSQITGADFQNATIIGSSAFNGCVHLSKVSIPKATSIHSYAFYKCSDLASAIFPSAVYLGHYAFGSCSDLSVVDMPNVTTLSSRCFSECGKLTEANFPRATIINTGAFCMCDVLSTGSFPNVSRVSSSAFWSCPKLMSLYFLSTSVASLVSRDAFSFTPMQSSTYTGSFGSIYVPASLVDSYKSATNWSGYSARITSYVE